jgi:RNA polymerase sigma-70 factor (ECF subfamily)
MKKEYGKYNDAELFQALKNKKESEAAFGEIYARYSQRIFAYCLRIVGNQEDAQDIFQETFLKFYKTTENERIVDNISAFMLTIARNLCLNHKRDHKLTIAFEEFRFSTNDESYEHKELMQLIATALELLDFEYREAFVLRQYHGMSYKEISDIVGDTVSTVKNRVWRAKEKLKDILSPYLEDLSK